MDAALQKMLDEVLGITGDRATVIDHAVRTVIGRSGIHDRARRGYVYRTLTRAAKDRIRRAQQKHQRTAA